jgi:D-alanine-D-alanine ligase
VIVLCHADLVPPTSSLAGLGPREAEAVRTEWDVAETLRRAGHDVQVLGVSDDLQPIRQAVEGWRPHAIFNLLMEFRDVGVYQVHVASYLELLGVPVTGSDARGILLTRDKALSKQLLRFHRIPTPGFAVFPRARRIGGAGGLRLPLIVKSREEEASLGIAQASVIRDAAKLRERVAFVHRTLGTDAIAEEYVEGRELTIGVLGNRRLTALPVWELFFESLPPGSAPIATARAKFDDAYRRRVGIRSGAAALPGDLEARIRRLAKRAYRGLGLSGYARVDLRLSPDGRVHVIEVNATPDVAEQEDLAASARAAGIPYPRLLQRILDLAVAGRGR